MNLFKILILQDACISLCIRDFYRFKMADDAVEPQPASAPAADGAIGSAGAEPPKKFPKGVVLGKDGKP